MKRQTIKHEFVEFIPESLEDGALYVSVRYATAVHLCCCGCGQKVIMPLSPADWKLIYDGETVSFHPSVGNWSFPCKSHYWIRQNQVAWAAPFSRKQIAAVRARDAASRTSYPDSPDDPMFDSDSSLTSERSKRQSLWSRIIHPFRR